MAVCTEKNLNQTFGSCTYSYACRQCTNSRRQTLNIGKKCLFDEQECSYSFGKVMKKVEKLTYELFQWAGAVRQRCSMVSYQWYSQGSVMNHWIHTKIIFIWISMLWDSLCKAFECHPLKIFNFLFRTSPTSSPPDWRKVWAHLSDSSHHDSSLIFFL